jgi:hypothetical protein
MTKHFLCIALLAWLALTGGCRSSVEFGGENRRGVEASVGRDGKIIAIEPTRSPATAPTNQNGQ